MNRYSSLPVLLLLAATCWCQWVGGATGLFDFRADYYRRDLKTNTILGRGNAWVRSGAREIYADEIEVLLGPGQVNANGHVHIKDGAVHLWGVNAVFSLRDDQASIEDATLISGQLIATGKTIRRTSKTSFEVDDGQYSNCNLSLSTEPTAAQCPMGWKISARRFYLTLGEYAHFHDVLIYTKTVPILYTPYFFLPVKTQRQSGLLIPSFSAYENLGSGLSLPLFLALSPWQDLTLTTTHYSKAGMHYGLNYRYNYDGKTSGHADIFTTHRRYGLELNDPRKNDSNAGLLLGAFGESAIDLHNQVFFSDQRTQTRQVLRAVTHPYYTYDYTDISGTDLGYLRSQLSLTHPSEHYLAAGSIQHHQSLVASKDSGVDEGPVTLLPGVIFSRTTDSLVGTLLSFEFDSSLNNYYRPQPFDNVPSTMSPTGVNSDPNTSFDTDDYLRTGRRLQLEPRLILQLPSPYGVQVQPVLQAGSLIYNFDYPTPSLYRREYVDLEVPLTLFLSRRYSSQIEGFEQISHVLQPRAVFSTSVYRHSSGNHQFFYEDTIQGLANPKFDNADDLGSHKYLRLELINRFRHKNAATGQVKRFALLMVSQQFNSRTSSSDPKYENHLGPIETLSEISLGRFTLQLQSFYQLSPTRSINGVELPEPVYENDWSGSINYTTSSGDRIVLDGLFRHRADPQTSGQTMSTRFYKSLPLVFDLEGGAEYSLSQGDLRAYNVGFHFRERPRSCWGLSLGLGQNAYQQKFVLVNFQLDFGNATAL